MYSHRVIAVKNSPYRKKKDSEQDLEMSIVKQTCFSLPLRTKQKLTPNTLYREECQTDEDIPKVIYKRKVLKAKKNNPESSHQSENTSRIMSS